MPELRKQPQRVKSDFYNMHKFHIPVMGTGFTADTPLRIAQYGISSVISLVDDVLLEQLRKYYSDKEGLPYQEIGAGEDDARARRITGYLNLVSSIVNNQIETLRVEPFEPDSRITRYFELLPDGAAKIIYNRMLAEQDAQKKSEMQNRLRQMVTIGAIDVNIMTKVNRANYRGAKMLPAEFNDATAALRGFALSDLNSSVVFSAGFNQRLYSYLTEFDDFYPDSSGKLRKKVILKVSDFRSAEIQGKFLTRKGIWVSEYRVESGLNCGGHTFPTKGTLLGPILEQFRLNRERLIDNLSSIYEKTLEAMGKNPSEENPPVKFTAQGGVGNNEEHEMLLDYYKLNSTGWGTPFLLVPEVTNIDPVHLERCSAATEDDVYLSGSSPLGVPFWNLRTSGSEIKRRQRIEEGRPGSSCPRGYLATSTEVTEVPVCTASRLYQKKKLESIEDGDYSAEQKEQLIQSTLEKSCICHDLSGSIKLQRGIELDVDPAVCCGPNIAYFSHVVSLEDMLGHIYGRRKSLCAPERPHVFIQELSIYLAYLQNELEMSSFSLSKHIPDYFNEFIANLRSGIEYYRGLAQTLSRHNPGSFLSELARLSSNLDRLELVPA